jgi:hypothetical protein
MTTCIDNSQSLRLYKVIQGLEKHLNSNAKPLKHLAESKAKKQAAQALWTRGKMTRNQKTRETLEEAFSIR